MDPVIHAAVSPAARMRRNADAVEMRFDVAPSDSELARRIDAPRSTRAVARACAANPHTLAIPCHRVIGRGGDLTGYRWGIERKRAVLETEARS